ncbi:MAG: acyl-CoA dehydrogenase family protein [Steroidobacteraceae bacterium]
MTIIQERSLLTDGHRLFRDTVSRFFRDEVEPNVKEWEKAGGFPAELFRVAARYGLLQAGMPLEYGGMGGDFLHHTILHEGHGFSVGGASIGNGICTDGVSYLFYAAGTEEQRKEWIPRFASGEAISEAAFTEPQSGSDVAGTRTYARRDGSDYVINGSKTWITNGSLCTVFPVLARTEKSSGGSALSVFIVDANAPGVHVSKPIETAHRGCSIENEIFFQDVRVPAERLLGGAEGVGFRQAMGVINNMRVTEAARFTAAAELAFDLTTEYVRNRKAFGQPILSFQNTQFQLADMKAELAMLRAYIDQCLARTLNDTLTPEDSSIAKLMSAEIEFKVMDRCLQLHGGMGYANEMPISKLWTLSRVHRIFLGTSEIHRMMIARSI